MAQAIRLFRAALGETQREFAQRTKLTLTSIGRYETNARPSPQVMRTFATIAREQNLPLFVEVFENRLEPENADLENVELSAAAYELEQTINRSGLGLQDLQRMRLTLWLWSVPMSKLTRFHLRPTRCISAVPDDRA